MALIMNGSPRSFMASLLLSLGGASQPMILLLLQLLSLSLTPGPDIRPAHLALAPHPVLHVSWWLTATAPIY